MDDKEKIDADSDAGSFAEEDWNDPEQNEVPKWTEPDLSNTAGTRTGNRKRTGMRYNRYGDDFLIDKIQPEEIGEEIVNVGELVADEEEMANHKRQRTLLAGRSLDTRKRDRPGAERDRKEGKHKLEDTGMDALPQEQGRRGTKYPAGRRVSRKTCDNKRYAFRLDSYRSAT